MLLDEHDLDEQHDEHLDLDEHYLDEHYLDEHFDDDSHYHDLDDDSHYLDEHFDHDDDFVHTGWQLLQQHRWDSVL